MADSLTPRTPISQLPLAGTLTGNELVPMDQGGKTVGAPSRAFGTQAIAGQTINWTAQQNFTQGATVTGQSGQAALTVTANGGPDSHGLVIFGDITLNGIGLGLNILLRNLQNGDYAFTTGDISGFVYHTVAGAHTYTIPDDTVTDFPIGTPITVSLGAASGNITLSPGGATVLRQAGTTNTGARTLAANAQITLLKVDVNEWMVNGVGMT